jgi:hypothetical protein
VLPVIEAVAKIPCWLPAREAVARVARHLGCTPEAAELQIVDKGKGNRIKARGVIEGQSVPLQIVGEGKSGRITVTTMKPRDVSCEITNVELLFIDLIAADLLPAPAEKARWSAAEAIAYFVKGVPLPWEAWQGAGASPGEIEQAEIDLGQAIGDGVPAWGRPRPFAPEGPIPADDFHADMIEEKRVRVGRRPKVVVRIDGTVGVSPPQRSANYKGPPWGSIKVDSAALRQARPRPAEPAPAPPTESLRVAPAPSSPKLSAQEPPPEEAEQQGSLLFVPNELQRKWRRKEAPTWFKKVRERYPQKPGENKSAYAGRLHDYMKNDFESPPWSDAGTVRRRLNDPDYA